MKTFFLALIVLCAAATPAFAQPWRLADVAKLVTLRNLSVSPDGKTYAFDSWQDDLDRAWYTGGRFQIAATGEGTPAPSSIGGSGILSPDGRSILNITDEDANYKLTLRVAEQPDARARVLVALPTFSAIDAAVWSPDSTMIAYVRDEPIPHDPYWKFNVATIDPIFDLNETSRLQLRHIWIVDAATGLQRELTADDDYRYADAKGNSPPVWSPNLRTLITFRSKSGLANDVRQWVSIDVKSGAATPFSDSVNCLAEVPSATGSKIASVCHLGNDPVARTDVIVDGRDRTASLDENAMGAAWVSDDALVAELEDGPAARLYLVKLDGTSPTPLTPADENVRSFSVSATENTVAYVSSSETRADEIYIVSLGNDVRRQITHANDMTALPEVVPCRTIAWTNSMGKVLDGLLFTPPGASSKTPLIIWTGGAPSGGFNFGFDPFAQYFASHGYAVFEPNARGSFVYGDWSGKSVVRDWASGPASDVVAGIDEVERMGLADRKREFLVGLTSGGYSSAWMVTHSNRFRAAVSGFGFASLALFSAYSDRGYEVAQYFGERPLGRAASVLAAQSPLTFVDAVRTPTMFLAYRNDPYAPIETLYPMYRELADRGVATSMWRYLDTTRPESTLMVDLQIAQWFSRYGGVNISDAIPGRAKGKHWIGSR